MRFISPLRACFAALVTFSYPCAAQHFTAPAGERTAVKRLGAESILPGGRLITPLGRQHVTGPGPYGIAVSPNGKRIATADGGIYRSSITVYVRSGPSLRRQRLEAAQERNQESAKNEGRKALIGIAFDGNNRIYVSEGDSGRVRLMNAGNGERIRSYSLNQGGIRESDSAGLALDSKRKRLYVVDRANARMAVVDLGSGRVTHSIPVGRLPQRISLSPDKRQAFVASMEMAPDPPGSAENRESAPAPDWSDANGPGSNIVTVVDLAETEPRVTKRIRVGPPSNGGVEGARGPCGVLATEDSVYVSTGRADGITVIDRATLAVAGEIPLRIPGLESLRGILPMGMAFDGSTKRLYVAEGGINALAVIDTERREVLGHLPVGWFPVDVQVHGGNLYVANAKGQGTGPNASREEAFPLRLMTDFGDGTLSMIPLDKTGPLDAHTAQVMANNGFTKVEDSATPIPEALKHVVLIIKGNRSYDEVFGDMERAANGPVNGAPALARFGNLGFAEKERSGLITRGELKDLPITPNHRALAERFAFSDNFYRDSEVDAVGLWHHLETHGVSFHNFGGSPGADSGYSGNVPDQYRASQFIAGIEELYRKPGRELPRLVAVHLPSDGMAPPRAEGGYPYRASYVADNDIALGKVVEYLSKSPWWKDMAILIAEDSARGGVDHVDSHRSILLVASPYARRNYASHRNVGLPGLLKTAFRILGVPPLNLYDAAAADLSDCFTGIPDFRPYESRLVKKELFDPDTAMERFVRN